ncbi:MULTISPECIES: glycoside hydrolase family 20 protein [unclassified Streptomyces]|uniref:beta-N-acetylhexosaminidase n=1 Tax=unclassified Streptomyces TaxID=2593676 RepID=UPI001BE5C116|nr:MULTISPECIES: glycoside hydrolase family 20 protein [unclassified Streptomyces]MBT2405196.1 family 20 glycosylhydrolase [Streptomyces sp. ISL-21]MBT2610964.1 family 20 glycosylhydrolase [Streptomyces sp. ISL-87]
MSHSRQARRVHVLATASVAALISLAVPACTASSGDARSAPTGPATGPSASAPAGTATPTPTPSPTPSYPLSTAPRTIPAVREHTPARGPGWKPAADARVVVPPADSAALSDEGRLLAGELHIGFAESAAPRRGDVQLALGSKDSGPAESYTLTVRDGQVRITGPDEAGVFYGTRTLKQAVRTGGLAPEGTVRDGPAKPQRGLNLDIARKHFTPDWIENRLREMADLKLNQLGLHFSDDQAFRIESGSHPEIVSTPHLTKADVRRITALAARLHIAVVPEIDSPGHLGAVLRAHPGLQLRNVQGRAVQGAVDISNPAAAKLVDDLLREYLPLFPAGSWHLGADEYQALVVSDPQASFPQLASAARQRYGPSGRVQDLATGWLNDRAAVVRPSGKALKAWNDGFFPGGVATAAKDIQVEYWTGKENGARPPLAYLSAGRKVVNLNDEYLYYVLGEPNQFTYPTGRRIYEQWTPLVLRGTSAVPTRYGDQILGARLAVWCDRSAAQTQSQVAAGIRLPLAALSQKVWDARAPQQPWPAFKALADQL